MTAPLPVGFRGYDTAQVDELLQLANRALASGRETMRASARQALRTAELQPRLRGYGRRQVKRVVEQRLQALSAG